MGGAERGEMRLVPRALYDGKGDAGGVSLWLAGRLCRVRSMSARRARGAVGSVGETVRARRRADL